VRLASSRETEIFENRLLGPTILFPLFWAANSGTYSSNSNSTRATLVDAFALEENLSVSASAILRKSSLRFGTKLGRVSQTFSLSSAQRKIIA
jgi:hypothetical protein